MDPGRAHAEPSAYGDVDAAALLGLDRRVPALVLRVVGEQLLGGRQAEVGPTLAAHIEEIVEVVLAADVPDGGRPADVRVVIAHPGRQPQVRDQLGGQPQLAEHRLGGLVVLLDD